MKEGASIWELNLSGELAENFDSWYFLQIVSISLIA
jgi:hypothetical protein